MQNGIADEFGRHQHDVGHAVRADADGQQVCLDAFPHEGGAGRLMTHAEKTHCDAPPPVDADLATPARS